jgi:hypothetical protein
MENSKKQLTIDLGKKLKLQFTPFEFKFNKGIKIKYINGIETLLSIIHNNINTEKGDWLKSILSEIYEIMKDEKGTIFASKEPIFIINNEKYYFKKYLDKDWEFGKIKLKNNIEIKKPISYPSSIVSVWTTMIEYIFLRCRTEEELENISNKIKELIK